MLPRSAYRQNRVRVERQAEAEDGYGNTVESWDNPLVVTERWAAFRPKFGREALEAGRLEATMTGVLTLRRNRQTATILPSDRIVFTYGAQAGTICQIRGMVPTTDSREIEMVIETGVAV